MDTLTFALFAIFALVVIAGLIVYCSLANFRRSRINILLVLPGIKAQSTTGRQPSH